MAACTTHGGAGGSATAPARAQTNAASAGNNGNSKSEASAKGPSQEQIRADVAKYLDPKNADYGPLMAPQERATALRAMTKDLSAALEAKTSAEREAKALAIIKSRPEIEASGVIPGFSVWGRFKDGRILTIPTYSVSRTQVAAKPKKLGIHLDKPFESAFASRAKELPVPETAAIIDAMRWDVPFSKQIIDAADHAGYKAHLVTNGDASVKGLRSGFRGEGFFYLHMHGGAGYERGKGDEPPVFALQSSTPVRDCSGKLVTVFDDTPFEAEYGTTSIREVAVCSDHEYEEELVKGRLVYAFAPGVFRSVPGKTEDVRADGWYYAITGKFIDTYASFGEHSWMYLNICKSASPIAQRFIGVMQKKGLVGAAGWTDSVDPTNGMRAAELFMKRLLGAKDMVRLVGSDSPPGRPWDTEATWAEVKKRNWDHSTVEENGQDVIAELILVGGNALLRPSISHMDVDELKKELTIHGQFGTKPGKVTIDKKDCPVKQDGWSEDRVVCDLGDDGKAGNVVVEVNGRTSNPAPLTLWSLKLDWSMDWPKDVPGGFGGGFVFDLRFRGDAHGYRETPDGAPKDVEPFYMLPAPGSTCSPNSKGDLTKPFGHIGSTGGGEVIIIKNEPPSGDAFCRAYAWVDPQGRTMKVALLASKARGSFNMQGVGTPGFGLLPTPKIFSEHLAPPPTMRFPALQAVVMPLDENLSPKETTIPDTKALGPKTATATMKIGGNATKFYPTLDTER